VGTAAQDGSQRLLCLVEPFGGHGDGRLAVLNLLHRRRDGGLQFLDTYVGHLAILADPVAKVRQPNDSPRARIVGYTTAGQTPFC